LNHLYCLWFLISFAVAVVVAVAFIVVAVVVVTDKSGDMNAVSKVSPGSQLQLENISNDFSSILILYLPTATTATATTATTTTTTLNTKYQLEPF